MVCGFVADLGNSVILLAGAGCYLPGIFNSDVVAANMDDLSLGKTYGKSLEGSVNRP